MERTMAVNSTSMTKPVVSLGLATNRVGELVERAERMFCSASNIHFAFTGRNVGFSEDRVEGETLTNSSQIVCLTERLCELDNMLQKVHTTVVDTNESLFGFSIKSESEACADIPEEDTISSELCQRTLIEGHLNNIERRIVRINRELATMVGLMSGEDTITPDVAEYSESFVFAIDEQLNFISEMVSSAFEKMDLLTNRI